MKKKKREEGFFAIPPPSKPENYWTLYFDGSISVNPGGIASFGWRLESPDKSLIYEDHGILCKGKGATVNVAEWGALEKGLEFMKDLGFKVPLVCLGDSQLVVNQVTDRWRFKKLHLKAYYHRVRLLLKEVATDWTVEWIPRHENTIADELSKEGRRRR